MVKIEEILNHLKPQDFAGNAQVTIQRVTELKYINKANELAWCNKANLGVLPSIKAGTIICPVEAKELKLSSAVNFIFTHNPRRLFTQVLSHYFAEKWKHFISPSAQIHPSVTFGENVFIGHHVVIEEGCVVGNHCYIGHNTVIYRKTEIGNQVIIGSNCTIGNAGFGYEKNADGHYEHLYHLGNVVLKDYVEVGNNTCIDRALLTSTILEENVKVDNLVHIAHNVIVRKNALIIANAMIAGSTEIGENVWVAPSASVINKITVEKNAVIGMGAVVVKPVKENEVVAGNPAKPFEKKS